MGGVAYYKVDGYEGGDDIMATLAFNTDDEVGGLLTKDKDLFQIVDDRIKIYDSQKGDFAGRDMVEEKFGIPPDKVRELLALSGGDASDNIPGVPGGVGVKTAAKLLIEHGSLDGIYENIESVKGKLKDKLIDNKDKAYMSYDLVGGLDILDENPQVEIIEDKQALSDKLMELELKTIHAKLFSGEAAPESVAADIAEIKEGEVKDVQIAVHVDGRLYVTDGENYCEFDGHSIDNAEYFYDIKSIYRQTGVKIDGAKDIFLMSWLNDPDSGGISKGKTDSMEQFIGNLVSSAESEYKKLDENGLMDVYENMELPPVAYCLGEMENNGIGFDKDVMKKVADQLQDEVAVISDTIKTFVGGRDINLNSPKQLQGFLFDELGGLEGG